MVSLHLVPISQAVAKECVTRWHRHNLAPVGDIFRVGCATDEGVLVGVAMAGRPTARYLDDGRTIEVTRVSVDGTSHATSMLYAALTRAAWALGYSRVITYTQSDESGVSLRACGWRVIAERPASPGWSRVSRPRDDARYLSCARTLWEAPSFVDRVPGADPRHLRIYPRSGGDPSPHDQDHLEVDHG